MEIPETFGLIWTGKLTISFTRQAQIQDLRLWE